MPSVSKAQAIAARIAEHNPEALYGKNKGMEKMSKPELHKFATTKPKNFPNKKGRKK